MCYARGPRCSSYAYKRLLAIQERREKLHQEPEYSWETFKEMEREEADAQLEFDSTPLGQERLAARLKDPRENAAALNERIEKCRQYRQLQMAATNTRDVGDVNHEGESLDYSGFTSAEHPEFGEVRTGWDDSPEKTEAYSATAVLAAQKLTKKERASATWGSGEGHASLNAYLADPGSYQQSENSPSAKEMRGHVQAMDRAFRKNRVSEPAVTYRGVDDVGFDMDGHEDVSELVEARYSTGSEFTTSGYSSTSFDPTVAQGSAKIPVVLEVKAKSLLPTGELTGATDRREALLNRQTTLRVTSTGWENYGNPDYPWDVLVVQCEEVDRTAKKK